MLGLFTNIRATNTRGGEGMKTICQFCGWEITKPEWYNSYDGSYACDDCLMDKEVERQRELEDSK